MSSDALSRCLNLTVNGAGLLLIEDGVLNAVDGSRGERMLREYADTLKLYVLQEDCLARGIIDLIPPYINITDYAGFVDLTVCHEKLINWS